MNKLLLIILTSVCLSLSSQMKTLYFFDDDNKFADGFRPRGELIFDGGYLYGTNSQGGGVSTASGCIYRIKPDGSDFSKFVQVNGGPSHGLFADANNFYLVSPNGGTTSDGAIIKVDKTTKVKTNIYEFTNGIDGANPTGKLISDGTYLYGMTKNGSTYFKGTIFRVKKDGTGFNTLHIFNDTTGRVPYNGLLLIGNSLYGVTNAGGTNDKGVIFKINTDGTNYGVLFNFDYLTGYSPSCNLIYDGTFIYGSTSEGGANSNSAGTVFKIKPNGTSYIILNNFKYETGRSPSTLLLDSNKLYGTTTDGGDVSGNGGGTLFKINTDGSNYSTLHTFNIIYNEGNEPSHSVIMINKTLYGTTLSDWRTSAGTVFGYKTNCITSSSTKNYTIKTGDSIKVGKHTYKTPGTYKDTVKTIEGCDSIATSIIQISNSVSIQSLIDKSNFDLIFTNNNIEIIKNDNEEITIEIFNSIGVLVSKNKNKELKSFVSMIDFTKGLYILKVSSNSSSIVKKIILD